MAEPKNMQKLPILCKYFAVFAKNYGAEGGFVQTPCYFEAAGAIYSKQFYAWRKPAQIPKGGKGGKIFYANMPPERFCFILGACVEGGWKNAAQYKLQNFLTVLK